MSDFLHFLNTADADALTTLPGVNTTLAEKLIEARPFDTIEDCLKVHGMGKNLLARIQASFEEMGIVPQESAILPVEEQESLKDTQAEKSYPIKEMTTETKPSFSSRLGQAILWFFRALLRLILIVLVIFGVGAAIYYGAPLFTQKFVAPVEQNAVRVSELENKVESLQIQLNEINSQLTVVNEQLNNQLNETNSRIDGIEQSVAAHTASLETLAEMQSALETELEEGNDKSLLALKQEVMMTRVLDSLARGRLYLAQSNFGLAKVDVQFARELLDELQAESRDEALSQAIERLDMASGNLPDFPVVASGDLEIAWQILMTGETVATATPDPTPTMTVTPESVLEPPVTATATP